jgi:hypothetical protein
MDDQHPRVGAVFAHDVFKKLGTFFGGRPSAQTLFDGNDIVVNRFR